MNPWVVHFYFPIFGTLFIPIDTQYYQLFSLRTNIRPNSGVCVVPGIGIVTISYLYLFVNIAKTRLT